jgi:hypothetical protein
MPADRPTLSRSGNVPWAIFDAGFYAAHTPSAADITDPDLVLEHYLQHGAPAGASPSPWFDEAFYRATYPDVVALIRTGDVTCGFEHYGQAGYLDRAPHWLFDPAYYQQANPDLTQAVLEASDFVNSYDHYLKFGARELRRAHPLFDPAAYLAHLPPDQAAACTRLGAYAHFLTQSWADQPEPPASHFDPAAHRTTYPELEAQIRAGIWHSALHHFLATPQQAAPPPAIKIHLDRPHLRDGAATDPITGHLDIIGWAASNHPITSVEIFVDDLSLGRAHHGIRTEGVAASFPEFVHAQFAGLRFIAATQIPPGPHTVRVLARDATGLERTESFTADFKPPPDREGPWSLRRRMRQAEADFKLTLLQNAGFAPEFVIILRNTAAPEAAARTHACLQRQVYPRWHLTDAAAASSDLWLIQLTPGDEPGVDALLELALHLLLHPHADFIYSDERRLDPGTGAMAPFFKPDWSPEFLLASNYIGRLWAVRAATVQRAGLDAPRLAESTAYDTILRLTEYATSITHVPKVLCETTPLPFTGLLSEERDLQAALTRRNLASRVEPGRLPTTWRIRPDPPATPLISIIIPTAGTGDLITTVGVDGPAASCAKVRCQT